MSNTICLTLFLIILLTSCKRTSFIEPYKDREALYQRFHGKYKIISSTTNEAIDLNLDGVASTDLNEEYLELENANLEIRILRSSSENLFLESWPEPYFLGSGGNLPVVYDPSITVTFARQGVTRTFQFDAALKNILLEADNTSIDPLRYTRPDFVIITVDDLIEVTKTKHFYTPLGWKDVKVVTLYKRYTMET